MSSRVRVINLAEAPGSRSTWTRPTIVIIAWMVCEQLLVRAPHPSSRLRALVLRSFGARIGRRVIIRPGVRVKSPWNLSIGDRTWIGEDVWIHNQERVTIGADVVISQASFITTGTHAYKRDMALVTRPVTIEDGAWVTSRCTVLAGSRIGRSSMVLPNTVVRGNVEENKIFGAAEGKDLGARFEN